MLSTDEPEMFSVVVPRNVNLHLLYKDKFLVRENLLGDTPDSDSDLRQKMSKKGL